MFFIKPSSGSRFVPNKVHNTRSDIRSQHKGEQVTRNPTPSHVQYDMLSTFFKNNYRLKATSLGTNLFPDDGFIKKNRNMLEF